MQIKKIVNILEVKLNNIYCNNCNRKSMRWKSSNEFCEQIAKEIKGIE